MSETKVALFNKRTRAPLDGTVLCQKHATVEEKQRISRGLGKCGKPYVAEWRELLIRLDAPCIICAAAPVVVPKVVVPEPVVLESVVLKPAILEAVVLEPDVPAVAEVVPEKELETSETTIQDPWKSPPAPEAVVTKTGGGNLKNGDDLSSLITKQRDGAREKKTFGTRGRVERKILTQKKSDGKAEKKIRKKSEKKTEKKSSSSKKSSGNSGKSGSKEKS